MALTSDFYIFPFILANVIIITTPDFFSLLSSSQSHVSSPSVWIFLRHPLSHHQLLTNIQFSFICGLELCFVLLRCDTCDHLAICSCHGYTYTYSEKGSRYLGLLEQLPRRISLRPPPLRLQPLLIPLVLRLAEAKKKKKHKTKHSGR